MRKSILVSAGLLALAAFPAMADGYRNAPPPNRGPEALTPQEREASRESEVHVVKIIRETAPAYTSSACCCCQPVTYGHHTYTTEPVVTRRYTRTYTRMAPPDCGHDGHHRHHGHHAHHRDAYYPPHQASAYSERAYAEPIYEENSVIWSSGGRETMPPAYGAVHNDRAEPWAHYDRGWRN